MKMPFSGMRSLLITAIPSGFCRNRQRVVHTPVFQHMIEPQHLGSTLPSGQVTLMSRVKVLGTGSILWFTAYTRY